ALGRRVDELAAGRSAVLDTPAEFKAVKTMLNDIENELGTTVFVQYRSDRQVELKTAVAKKKAAAFATDPN
ncbi:hypothetical protein ACP3W1_29560, partial [Salmonella enterica]|uniref:hypothetical protein n=1 Tax=Salmonella enterica TaxID=28901 RepID=UPI003CEF4D61